MLRRCWDRVMGLASTGCPTYCDQPIVHQDKRVSDTGAASPIGASGVDCKHQLRHWKSGHSLGRADHGRDHHSFSISKAALNMLTVSSPPAKRRRGWHRHWPHWAGSGTGVTVVCVDPGLSSPIWAVPHPPSEWLILIALGECYAPWRDCGCR
jgi:hypothetical protein